MVLRCPSMAQAPAASADSDVIVLHLLAWATCTMTLKHKLDILACHLLHCDDVSGHFYNGHTCASHSHPAAVMGGSQLSASGNKQSCTLTLPEVSHGTQRLDCVYEWNSAGPNGLLLSVLACQTVLPQICSFTSATAVRQAWIRLGSHT